MASDLESELFADLLANIDAGNESMAAASDAAVNPVLISIVRTWVIAQVRRLACENRDVILQTVQRYIDTYISNDQVAIVLMNVAEAVVASLCPQ